MRADLATQRGQGSAQRGQLSGLLGQHPTRDDLKGRITGLHDLCKLLKLLGECEQLVHELLSACTHRRLARSYVTLVLQHRCLEPGYVSGIVP
jgi:hypothetical protein